MCTPSLATVHAHSCIFPPFVRYLSFPSPTSRRLQDEKIKPAPYPFGSRGPAAADALAHKYGMSKFGGGITPYVEGQPPKGYPVQVSLITHC